MRPWLVLPVKPVQQGKSRLAPHVGAVARRALNLALFVRTLGVAARFPGPDRTLVISRCPEVLRLAHAQGTATLAEAEPGLNEAVSQAVAALPQARGEPIVIVACDLPLVSQEDLKLLVKPGELVLATDRAGSGTNALCLPAGVPFRFHYGVGSRLRHVAEAALHGLPCRVLQRPSLAFDLDNFDDYCEWQRIGF